MSRQLPDATIQRMHVRLLAFASAAQAIGTGACDWQLPGELSVRELRQRLAVDFPALAPLLPRLAIALEGTVADSAAVVRDGAEIALLPPSPAADRAHRAGRTAARRPRDARRGRRSRLRRAGGLHRHGAQPQRPGRWPRGGRDRVQRLRHDGGEGARRIAAELEAGAPGLRVALCHRLGRLAVGEASIAIVAVSPRRDAALVAIRKALERVKSEAPIWKREVYADGGARWREDEPLAPPGLPGGDGLP